MAKKAFTPSIVGTQAHPAIYGGIDLGNRLAKGHGFFYTSGDGMDHEGKTSVREVVFPHAIALDPGGIRFREVSTSTLTNDEAADTDHYGVLVDGQYQYYVVGSTAEQTAVLQSRQGADKYRRDYAGVLLAVMLVRLFPNLTTSENKPGWDHVVINIGYPPGDSMFTRDLVDSIKGRHTIKLVNGTVHNFNVTFVTPVPEPRAGYANYTLDTLGRRIPSRMINGSVLIPDVGGRRSSVLRILNGGKSDISRTLDIGIWDVMDTFTRLLRTNYPKEFRSVRHFNEATIRAALQTNQVPAGGEMINVEKESGIAKAALINQLTQWYMTDFEGGVLDAAILLNGGGAAYLYTDLMKVLNHANIHSADRVEELHLSTARGLAKLCKVAVMVAARGGK